MRIIIFKCINVIFTNIYIYIFAAVFPCLYPHENDGSMRICTQKWMVDVMKTSVKIDDNQGYPHFRKPPYME